MPRFDHVPPSHHRRPEPPPVRSRVDTMATLRAFAAGHMIPRPKYEALKRAALIKVRGTGGRAKPHLTPRGAAALAHAEHHA